MPLGILETILPERAYLFNFFNGITKELTVMPLVVFAPDCILL